MIYALFRFVLIMLVVGAAAVVSVNAQTDADAKEDLPKGINETLAKNRIERDKKDFAEMLARGEEAAKLSEEVDKSFVQNKQLTSDDRKKLERLEKLSKKIREELGASGDDDSDDDALKVSSTSDAVDKLKTFSLNLAEELKKSTRYTISAVAVQSSNAVLRIVRFIKMNKN